MDVPYFCGRGTSLIPNDVQTDEIFSIVRQEVDHMKAKFIQT
jgi:hypothetical protein